MEVPRRQIVQALRRAGLADLAAAAVKTLPDPVDTTAIDQFCDEHGLSREALIDRMGGSP
jgi:hypothetical protein